MLHDDWHGTFPLRYQVLESLASEFGHQRGSSRDTRGGRNFLHKGGQAKGGGGGGGRRGEEEEEKRRGGEEERDLD